MSGVEAVACVIRGALANAGCGDEVYLYTPEDFHPDDDELIYDQSAIDTLRAQLEAAEAGNHRRSDSEPTWAELTQYWKARAEAAEADAARRLEAMRRAVIALARAANCDRVYLSSYEELSAAIDAAMSRTKEETK